MAYENREHNTEDSSQDNVRLIQDISRAAGMGGDGSPREQAGAPKERSSR